MFLCVSAGIAKTIILTVISNDMTKVIILAGGKGTRLPDSARDIPKALVPVEGKPMIDHVIEMLENHGFSDIRFSLGFRADAVVDHLGRPRGERASLAHEVGRAGGYEYVVEKEPLGTGGALKFASRDLTGPFIALNGDVITDINVKEFLDGYERLPHIPHSVAVYETDDARDYGLVKLEGDHILRFQEKPKERRSGFINAGFYILHPEALHRHPQNAFSVEYDIFPSLARNRKLGYFIHRGRWTDAGTEERLRLANDANAIS